MSQSRGLERLPRTHEQARDALRRLIDGCWRRGKEACFSIPVNNERDADMILGDVIEEWAELKRTRTPGQGA